MVTIAIDPSGNFEEGRGHTGMATINDSDYSTITVKSINAKDFETRHEYWHTVRAEISRYVFLKIPVQVVIESYVVRANGFTTGKMPETAMLIGVLTFYCEQHSIPVYFQAPSQAKARFKDNLLPSYIPNLVYSGKYYYLGSQKLNDHERDALKHLLYFKRYKEYKI